MRSTARYFWVAVAILFISSAVNAATLTTIKGTVTDNTGKAIRGAMISANQGTKLIARFSQADGRYSITVPAGSYDVKADAYGFGSKRITKDSTQTDDTNFSLAPAFSVAQLTSAEVEELLPNTDQARLLEIECIRCHALTYPARRAGMTATEWSGFIPTMTRGRYFDDPAFSGDRLAALSAALEKYFGPDSQYFGPDATLSQNAVRHTTPTDAVLKATMHEFRVPTRDPFAHSITTDAQGNGWFSELSEHGNKIAKFNWETEEFTEYPLPWPHSGPHTGAFDKNGTLWMTLTGATIPAKLASLNPETGEIKTYDFPGNKARTHTLGIDNDGNVWMSGTTLLEFDVKSQQFKEYKLPIPKGTDYSKDTWQAWHNVPGKDPMPIGQNTYDTKADSKGMIWTSIESVGLLIRLNPKTGEMKTFTPPESPSIKGVEVDKDDNVWFAVFWGSRLGKFDQKTEKFTMYTAPTKFAMPYGISADRKTGDIWYADLNGNYITKFDPKTEKFDQYPIPSGQASPRFPAVDPNSGRVWFTEFMNDKIGYLEPGVQGSPTNKGQ
jgi:virginiamycin B lyase